LLHQLREALALFAAEQVLRRRDHVLEEQFRRVGGVQADLVEVAAAPETVIARGFDDDQRKALGAGPPVRATTMIRSAVWPLVMKVFWPLTT
jgi:hypothetical protein